MVQQSQQIPNYRQPYELLNTKLDDKIYIKESIETPRLHHQLYPNQISYQTEFSKVFIFFFTLLKILYRNKSTLMKLFLKTIFVTNFVRLWCLKRYHWLEIMMYRIRLITFNILLCIKLYKIWWIIDFVPG